jgi:hypothetical protein
VSGIPDGTDIVHHRQQTKARFRMSRRDGPDHTHQRQFSKPTAMPPYWKLPRKRADDPDEAQTGAARLEHL